MIGVFRKTMYHFFPHFSRWLNHVDDPRQRRKITYPCSHLLWLGIFLFLVKLGSKRQIKFLFNTEEFKDNLALLTGSYTQAIAHPDTLENLLKKLSSEELVKIRRKMTNRLIRMKSLMRYRLLDEYYLISVDGTGYLAFKEKHCPHCLIREKHGKVIYYYHNVLDAKIVAENGLALSIETEFIENRDEGDSKQDCELKAFYRLVKRLKKNFPQLRICLLLDGLYAADPVFSLCDKYGWKYIVTFKEGSMPDTYGEYLSLKSWQPENAAEIRREEIIQKFNWVTDIDYRGPCFDVLECNESKPGEKGQIEDTRFVWITNLKIRKSNFESIGKGGRLRWKIENEGFNMQKNGGYNLEHAYSKDEVAMKNLYLLLQIAHAINQLMEKGSLLKNQIKKVFGSIRNVSRRLLEDLRTKFTDPEKLKIELSKPFQIRFDSS